MGKAYFAYITKLKIDFPSSFLTTAVLAQAVERWTCNKGGRGFDPRGRTYTQVLEITDKRHRAFSQEFNRDHHCALLFSKRYVLRKVHLT